MPFECSRTLPVVAAINVEIPNLRKYKMSRKTFQVVPGAVASSSARLFHLARTLLVASALAEKSVSPRSTSTPESDRWPTHIPVWFIIWSLLQLATPVHHSLKTRNDKTSVVLMLNEDTSIHDVLQHTHGSGVCVYLVVYVHKFQFLLSKPAPNKGCTWK